MQVLDTMSDGTYYKYLLVSLIPVTLYAVIINWWGLKVGPGCIHVNELRSQFATQIFRHA